MHSNPSSDSATDTEAQLRQRIAELEQRLSAYERAGVAELPSARVILDAIPVPIFVKDAAGVYRGCNTAFAQFLGFPHEAIMGHTAYDVAPPHLAELYHRADLALIEQAATQVYEAHVLHADGHERDVRFHKAVYRAPDGAVAGLVGAILDITEEKRVEAELRAREALLHTILQTALDGLWVIDLQQRFVDVNEAYCAMSGYTRDEILALRISDLEAIERPEETDARIQQIIARGSARFESRHRRKDGSTYDVEVSVTYVAADGLIVCFCRDITARKRSEQALEHQLRYAEALARCSQTLLRPAARDAEQQALLVEVITFLRDIVDVSHLYIFHPPVATRSGELALRILVDVYAPGQEPDILPSPEQIRDVPRVIIDALESGRWVGGPVTGRFPDHPHYQRSFEQNGVQSILMVPIIMAGSLWGVLSAADRIQPRVWDEPTVQLLRTAAEMFATFQQAWEITRTLREREHFIQRVTEASPDLIHVIDLRTWRAVYTNRPLAAMLGYPPEEIAAIDLEMLGRVIHPDDYKRALSHYDRVAESADGEVSELELRVHLGDGSERWLLTRDVIFARDAVGHAIQILSLVQDVTASKLTAHALASSEARLRALRDALPDLLFVVRADGTFLEFHAPRQQEILVPPELFLGRKLDEVLPPESAELALSAIARVRESGDLERFEDALTFRQRGQLFEVRIVPVAGDELLFVVRDITERHRVTEELRRAKEAAEAADRTKSAFLAHISHELRTPLTAVIGMATLLRDTDLSSRQEEYVSTISTGAETLLTIIGNILDFSKIEAGQMELSFQPFDLHTCLKEALDLVVHQARRKGLRLDRVIDPAVPVALVGDEARLHQVLVNLLGNAVKFTEHGAVMLTVSGSPLAEPGYELALAIHDTGIGIEPDRLHQIFDPFVQADSTTTRRFGGTGLGLAISKQLVELMGGRITVASTPGVGSTFTLTIPLTVAADSAAPSANIVNEEPQTPRRLHVLLAEDNLINQEVLRRMLESLGHRVDVVGDGVAALAAVARQPYDVVLMDIQMPELDGETATRRIRAMIEAVAQPAIIALTASALVGDRERYLAAGMDDYLSKPVQREHLQAALGRARAHRPLAQPADHAPSPMEPLPVDSLVDWALLDGLLASIGGAVQAGPDLLILFSNTLSAQIEAIVGAVAVDDRAQVRLLAHKLRGGSQQVGATRLAEQWAAIEAAACDEAAALAELLERARATYAETLRLLAARLAPSDRSG